MIEQEKTLEQRLAEAEAHLEATEEEEEAADAALDEARGQVKHAQKQVDALTEERDAPRREAEAREMAALVAAQTGPQAPIGDRVARRSCALSEIPTWFGEATSNGVRALIGERMCATNGYVIIDVETVEGLRVVGRGPTDPAAYIQVREARLVRADVPIFDNGFPCREFGTQIADLRYTTLVEELFPGCEWWSTGGELTPIQAYVDGHFVALVMPVRRSATVTS